MDLSIDLSIRIAKGGIDAVMPITPFIRAEFCPIQQTWVNATAVCQLPVIDAQRICIGIVAR